MFRLVIHGGAGLESPEILGAEREAVARKALSLSLQSGSEILANGGSAMEAVLAAVSVMEDDVVFNAGRGAVLASDGNCYFDASIMNGATREAGGICGTPNIRHPILLAEKVLRSPYVLLTGTSALDLAKDEGLECRDQEWFKTEYRKSQLERAIQAHTMILDHEQADDGIPNNTPSRSTVGAVALDVHGNIAAATSTGGMCNKPPGRIGDSALIGSGTYADNKTCAVSTTGHGEIFIQWNVANRLSSIIEFGGETLNQASRSLMEQLPNNTGGLIAVDKQGNITAPFNTGGMFHGWISEDQVPNIRIWPLEE
jgi:beta-aspartyl-peptidase (threonine type)